MMDLEREELAQLCARLAQELRARGDRDGDFDYNRDENAAGLDRTAVLLREPLAQGGPMKDPLVRFNDEPDKGDRRSAQLLPTIANDIARLDQLAALGREIWTSEDARVFRRAAVHLRGIAAIAKRAPACDIRIYSDQTICGVCGLTWDTNDSDPPRCLRG